MKKITLLIACLFAFYAQGQVYLAQENFDTDLGAWVATDGGGATGDTWASSAADGGLNGTGAARVDSDANGNGTALFETLTSPVFDSSSGTVVLLEFDQFYEDLDPGIDTGSVEVWDGAAWQQVLFLDATVGDFGTPDQQSIDITAFKNANMQVRFVYDDGNDWAWYWLLDNIVVREQPLCTPATVSYTVVDDCSNSGGFNVSVDITDMGSSTSIAIDDNQGSTTQSTGVAGIFTFGPYTNGTNVVISLTDNDDNNCNQSSAGLTQLVCPVSNDECANAIDLDPFANNDGTCALVYSGSNVGATNSAAEVAPSAACSDGDPAPSDVWFTLTVPVSGQFNFEFITNPGFSTLVELYTGSCGALTALNPVECDNGATRTFTGLTPSDTVYLRVWDFGSDEEGQLEFCVNYLNCTPATVGTSIVSDCNNSQFQIDVDVTDVGDATFINDGTNSYPVVAGSNLVGPYADGTVVSLTIEHSDSNCDFTLADVSFTCPTLPTVDATLTINGCLDSDSFSTAFEGVSKSFYWIQLDYDGGCFELTADTDGSDFDTELGLYDSDGFLVANNDDDAGGITPQSLFTEVGLPAGTYYLAAGEFNMTFGADSFNVTFPGTPNDTGTLVVNVSTPSNNTVDFCNIQFPGTATIESGNPLNVFAQVFEAGVTEPQGAQGAGIEAWIGFSETDATSTADFTSGDWTWVVADYNTSGPANNNDEYSAEIGSARAVGTYYYVSRFSIDGGPFVYGGSDVTDGDGGNFWDGTAFVSGVLTVNGPANDNFANAQPIDCTTTGLTGSTVDATLDEDDAPDGFGADMDAPNVWFSYDSATEGAADVTISLCGSSYDTSFLVYTGTSGNLTLVGGNDDNAAACGAGSTRSEGTFTANGTDVYYIAVEGWNSGSTGAFVMDVTCEASCTPAQTNQDCGSATALAVDGITTTQDNTCAVVNPVQPSCDAFQSIADLWFTFVAPASGEVDIVTSLGTATAAHLAVYEGTCGALTELDCSSADPAASSSLTGLVEGNTYFVQLWNNGSEEGTIDITLSDASLSVSSFDNENAFTYFPNPVKNELSLKAQNTIQNVSVFNMLGQEVLRATPNALESNLNMNQLNSGAYFVQVTINNVTQTVRVIKQ